MPKQLKKKQEEKNLLLWKDKKIGLLIFKTQSMKTSLNSYAVLLNLSCFIFLYFFFTENKAKLI